MFFQVAVQQPCEFRKNYCIYVIDKPPGLPWIVQENTPLLATTEHVTHSCPCKKLLCHSSWQSFRVSGYVPFSMGTPAKCVSLVHCITAHFGLVFLLIMSDTDLWAPESAAQWAIPCLSKAPQTALACSKVNSLYSRNLLNQTIPNDFPNLVAVPPVIFSTEIKGGRRVGNRN